MLRGRPRRKDRAAGKPIMKFNKRMFGVFQGKHKLCIRCRKRRKKFHHKYCEFCWIESKKQVYVSKNVKVEFRRDI